MKSIFINSIVNRVKIIIIVMSNQQKTKMNTIYLREKRSGNYEFSNRKKATLKFTTKKALREFWENKIDGQSKYLRYKDKVKVISATYSRSQIYYNSFADFYKNAINKQRKAL